MEKEKNNVKVLKVRYRYGGKVHYLIGSTSFCGVWRDFEIVYDEIEVNCKKCKESTYMNIIKNGKRKKS